MCAKGTKGPLLSKTVSELTKHSCNINLDMNPGPCHHQHNINAGTPETSGHQWSSQGPSLTVGSMSQ